MSLTRAWNFAGELVRQNGITKYSNCLLWVFKSSFPFVPFSDTDKVLTLHKSSLQKMEAFWACLKAEEMGGDKFLFFIVWALHWVLCNQYMVRVSYHVQSFHTHLSDTHCNKTVTDVKSNIVLGSVLFACTKEKLLCHTKNSFCEATQVNLRMSVFFTTQPAKDVKTDYFCT